MSRRGMHNFMSEHSGQFGFGLEFGQQAPVDPDLATRQCPGIGYRAVQHHEFIWQIDIALGGNGAADAPYIGRQPGIDVVCTALRLLHGQVRLSTLLDLLRGAHNHEFALAGDRIDGTRGQRDSHDQKGELAHCYSCGCGGDYTVLTPCGTQPAQ